MGVLKYQIIKVKWNSHNKDYYINLGYIFTKMGDEFILNNIYDAYKGASIIIECDYCGCISNKKIGFLMDYYKFNDIEELLNYDDFACKKCNFKKAKKTILKKYGVENAFQSEEIKERIKKTNLEKYGVENPNQSKEIKNKTKQTNLERYGVTCPAKNKEIKDKIKQTNLERYGVACNLQDPNKKEQIRERIKQTNLKKYGVEYPMQNINIRKKSKITMFKRYGYNNSLQSPEIRKKIYYKKYKNKSMPYSKNQQKISELVHGELNYPVDLFFIDVALLEEMIYIEYDGGGHNLSVKMGYISQEEFDKKQYRRKYVLQKYGWKLIRIISYKDKLYSNEQLLNLIDEAKQYLLNTKHTWVEIDIDNNEYRCSKYKYAIDVNNL